MKPKFLHTLAIALFCTPCLLHADNGVSYAISDPASGVAPSVDSLAAEYLKNLGISLGYNLESPKKPTPDDTTLLDASLVQKLEQIGFNSVLGAKTVNAISETISNFVPQDTASYAIINSLANYTFKSQTFNAAGSQAQGYVSVIQNIDQQQYQNDPVSQAVLNILGTPNYTYCINKAGDYEPTCSNLTESSGSTKVLNNYEVLSNVIGTVPGPTDFFASTSIQEYLSELNTNSLIGPLMYSTTPSSTSSTTTTGGTSSTPGMTAKSQAQQASNFIRYVTGLVEPLDLATKTAYSNLYFQAITGGKSPQEQQKKAAAQAQLAKYLAGLRIYAAQNSVALSNLYSILSKRLPQTQSADGSVVTSEALNEFKMATWRLYNPENQSAQSQWINQINTASPATVQKEMVILLAEINYQLYLSRQQQERMLLNSSIQLVNSLNVIRPGTIQPNSASSGN